VSTEPGAVQSAVLAASVSGAAGSAQGRWRIIDLGTLGGEASFAQAINDRGQIVGTTFNKSWDDRAFLWQNGKMTDLGMLPGGTGSGALAINDRGQILGWSTTKDGHQHAVLWQNGKITDLGTLGGRLHAEGYFAINSARQAIGWSETKNRRSRSFLWQNGKMTDLGTLGGPDTHASAINDHGQIVGQTTTKTESRAFVWQNGKMTDLGTLPGGSESEARAINEQGQIVGWSLTPSSAYVHPVLWENGQATDLGTLPGIWCGTAVAINDSGQVIVNCHTTSRHSRAFLWENGKRTPLRYPGQKETIAGDINNAGQIVGGISLKRGNHEGRAFVWQNGTMTLLGTLPGDLSSGALAINQRGEIIGTSTSKTGATHAVLWAEY
jgi:probable HAF family extracellular repeat protein